jgi:lipopolysaccharide transport system permease protein
MTTVQQDTTDDAAIHDLRGEADNGVEPMSSPEPQVALLSDEELAALPAPTLTIRPPKGWQALDLGELWRFRDLLTTLAGRDLKLRYKQTALGVIWVVLQPLLAAGIFAIVFGGVAGLAAPGGIPYFVFSYAGLLGWNLFSNTLTKTSACLVGNSNLISKIFFPRLVLPFSQTGSAMVDFGVALVMMAVLLIMFGVAPTLGLLLLPVWVVLLLCLSVGLGLITSSLAVQYRDINYILPVFVQMMLYASPVAYSLAQVVERLGGGDATTFKQQAITAFFYANPLTGLLEAMRWSLLGHGSLPIGLVAYGAVAAVGLLLAGAYGFKRMERRFADVI